MLFNSITFAFFFPAVAAIYFFTPNRFRWLTLLAASYVFYMAWKPAYALLIGFSTISTYLTALGMAGSRSASGRRAWLLANLAINLGILFFFKYYNFLADSLRPFAAWAGQETLLPYSHFLLPVGISFYTFQALGYSVDVYRGEIVPEKHLGRFALYLAFFPQLVAGPIERAARLLPQFRLAAVSFDYDRVRAGLLLMAWGLFQKVVIADRLAHVVGNIYGDPAQFGGPALAMATVFFAFQIYCDFAGYTDIAIGAAQVLGFRLMDNFRRPYFATSIADFWRRWHISLSTWFRDYLYFSLGGNRVSPARWRINIMIVFMLSGLWHGADWKFLVWGFLHGAYMLAGQYTAPARRRIAQNLRFPHYPRAQQTAKVLVTFTLVCFAWIFFRAATIEDALLILRRLPSQWNIAYISGMFASAREILGVWPREMGLCAVLILFLLTANAFQAHGVSRETLLRQPWWVRWTAYSALLWAIVLFGVMQQKEFIYFVF